MEKVRINDLARELEIKAKAVLDLLPEIGVKEKKTHSSSIAADEAEKVRQHFRAQAEAASSAKESKAARPAPGEIKTKIDLSKISKPGDVLKAITKQTTPPPVAARPTAPAAPAAVKPAAPALPADKIAKPAATAPAVAKPAAAAPAGVTPAARPAAPPAPAAHAAPPAPTAHAAPPATAAAGAPARRMITPQTGPRPVYQAPAAPLRAAGASSAPIVPGRPMP